MAVLLTYQGFEDCAWCSRFTAFLSRQLRQWKVKHWCATLETNADGKYHAHVMMQFHPQQDCLAKKFASEGLTPNAQTRQEGERPADLHLSSWHGRLPIKVGVVNLRQLI